MSESTYYQSPSVQVTSARVIVGGVTYALRNLTSVRMTQTNPKLGGPVILLIICMIIFMISAKGASNGSEDATIGIIIGVVGAIGMIAWMVKAKSVYHVSLNTAGNDTHAVSSKDRDEIERIVNAINEAIINN